jgi:putative DNA methylase
MKMTTNNTYKKKLIEVALPLDAINKASAREKSIRHGHPSTLHLWWARRPLAAARAVIFAQMVDDPSSHPELFPTEEEQEKERQRLFRIIEDLVLWENTTNEEVLNQAREEIWKSWRYTCEENKDHPQAAELFNPDKLPAFHDPFAGGGALPLEAQRLGLEAYASDLNPVAVLINKAMIEIPPKFANMPPVNPESRKQKNFSSNGWKGAQGLAEDVRYYGKWMRDEAEKRIGHLYPKVEITKEMAKERPDLEQYVGQKLTVIAWLWARTVKSPNPAFAHVDVPLMSTFMLSSKKGKEAYVEPIIEGDSYQFNVKVGRPEDMDAVKRGTKLARGANFECLMSGTPIKPDYVKTAGKAGQLGTRLIAIVAEGNRGRVYLPPINGFENNKLNMDLIWKPETPLPIKALGFSVQLYFNNGTFGDLFTQRQLIALTTFSDLIQEVWDKLNQDMELIEPASLTYSGLENNDSENIIYNDAVSLYLAIALNKVVDRCSTVCGWDKSRDSIRNTFGRQAIPMVWDFAESNPLEESSGSFLNALDQTYRTVSSLPGGKIAHVLQADAQNQTITNCKVVSTDPPYYDNIGYADLSEFFYVWLRRSLKKQFPSILATLAVPKADELVADPNRHGGKQNAESFFMDGMTQAMHRLAEQSHLVFPVTIYYAFKQAETESTGTSSTGWETFLEAVIKAGLALTGTWPVRTELGNRMRGADFNALASSIVLVCRPRSTNVAIATRREFLNQLKAELPKALKHLQHSNIAPVDLAQAAIGPGMAVFTRYSKVIDAEGNAMTVREALALINQILDEVLAEQEGDFDADSRWALSWFEQYGFTEGEYGVAETLSKAKNTSVSGLVDAGILASKTGKVRLLQPEELPEDWDPANDSRLTVWEMVHHLIRVLEAGGEIAAAELVAKLGSKADVAKELAYRLYTQCERKKRAQEALAYNSLVQSWPEIVRLAKDEVKLPKGQTKIIEEE